MENNKKQSWFGKESNPGALISEPKEPIETYSGASIKQNNIDLFSPRGDYAKDAFEQSLGDMIKDIFD
jgi:hypothetical protein